MPADNLSGTWYSGVGSTLELQVSGGTLTGFFESTETNPSKKYPLTGLVDPDTARHNRVLAFVVSWIDNISSSKYRSISSYTGQFHSKDNEINVTLLITDETSIHKQYRSTLVAHDTFTRQR